MRADLRAAQDRNVESHERFNNGHRLGHDSERLEELLDMYIKMTAKKEKVS